MGIGYAAQLGADAGLPWTDSVLTLNRTVLSRVAKVNSTDALIVLWAWHLVATPGRAKQAKVKSAKACHGASNDPPSGRARRKLPRSAALPSRPCAAAFWQRRGPGSRMAGLARPGLTEKDRPMDDGRQPPGWCLAGLWWTFLPPQEGPL